jgi:lactate dehydrogenase-like 2-hydroxyacid dehydrogenase
VRRIAITCVLPKDITEEFSREFDLLFLLRKLLTSPGEMKSFVKELAGCEALVVAPPFAVDRSLIDQLPSSLKVLATYSVGYDHLDVVAARVKGLSVLHTPDVLTDAVAEVALLLALGAARRVTESEQLLRSRHWPGWTPTQLIGQSLTDKVMGIFGYGRIGKAIAIRARSFGARICFHDSRPKAVTDGELATLVSDEQEFLGSCDVLVLAAPLNQQTKYFLDRRRLELMKSSAIVVNIGRGDLVRDDDLIRALRDGQIFAAGLDVFSNEPGIDDRYFDLPNVFMLPHIGSSTMEARVMMGRKLIAGITELFSGRVPTNSLT